MPITNALEPIVAIVVHYLWWAIPIMLGLTALKWLLLPKIKGFEGELLVGATLKRLAKDVLNDIVIPNGRSGWTQVDHVVLTDAGFLVVETKNYKGLIFGHERDSHWTQKLGRRSSRFQNPLRQNYLHVKAVQKLVPEVPIIGWVVFTDSARSPEGVPPGVSSLRTLRSDLAGKLADGPAESLLSEAWDRPKLEAETGREARKAHLRGVRARKGKNRATPVAIGMLAVSVVWLLALWMLEDTNRLIPTHVNSGMAPMTPSRHNGPTGTPWATASAPSTKATRRTFHDRRPREPDALVNARLDCNAYTAGLLVDNSREQAKRRDELCAKYQELGAAYSTSLRAKRE